MPSLDLSMSLVDTPPRHGLYSTSNEDNHRHGHDHGPHEDDDFDPRNDLLDHDDFSAVGDRSVQNDIMTADARIDYNAGANKYSELYSDDSGMASDYFKIGRQKTQQGNNNNNNNHNNSIKDAILMNTSTENTAAGLRNAISSIGDSYLPHFSTGQVETATAAAAGMNSTDATHRLNIRSHVHVDHQYNHHHNNNNATHNNSVQIPTRSTSFNRHDMTQLDYTMEEATSMIREVEKCLDGLHRIQVQNAVLMDSMVMVGADLHV